MNDGKSEGVYGPLIDTIKKHETNIVSAYCGQKLDTFIFPSDNVKIKRGGAIVTGNIAFGENKKLRKVNN